MDQIHLQPKECVQLKLRKHWFILLRDMFGTALAGIVPAAVVAYTVALGAVPAETMPLVLFFTALWLLVIWLGMATIWTHYYLDVWIVTDRRIIHIDQVSLFNREVTTLRMERVQDVTTEVRGILATLLRFGSLRVQTAGALDEYTVMHGMPRPESVKRAILREVDKCTERLRTDSRLGMHEADPTREV